MTLRRQVSRFLAVGAVNTVGTYALFIALGLFIRPSVAYTIAFAAGLAWVMLGTSSYVFGGSSAPRIVLYGLWYLGVYGVGQLVIAWVDPHDLTSLVATGIVLLMATVPLSFLGGRVIFAGGSSPHSEDEHGRSVS